MTPLALELYTLLVRQLRTHPSITYGELAVLAGRHPRSRQLHAALGEIASACRARQLPCLPAIVWRRDLQRPSDGYYLVAHPRVRTVDGRITAWQREYARVLAAKFPRQL